MIITQQLYEAEGGPHKFIPVVFSTTDTRHIPIELRGATFYILDDDKGYQDLYRHITGQPKAVKRQLGKLSLCHRGNVNKTFRAARQRIWGGVLFQ